MAHPERPGDAHYVFATFLTPGYHQFFVFDPLLDKVYCQEMIVEYNNCIHVYPELSRTNKQLQRTALPPVFKKWMYDDLEREGKAFYIDTSPFREKGKQQRDNFEPERFIKDPVDLQYCEDCLKQNFKIFQVFFVECLALSAKYPEIDLQTFLDQINLAFQKINEVTEGDNQFNLMAAELEIQYISATRSDDRNRRSLCRGEMLELMLRISNIKYRKLKIKMRRGLNKKARKSPTDSPEQGSC